MAMTAMAGQFYSVAHPWLPLLELCPFFEAWRPLRITSTCATLTKDESTLAQIFVFDETLILGTDIVDERERCRKVGETE